MALHFHLLRIILQVWQEEILIDAEIKDKAFCLKPKNGGFHPSRNFCQCLWASLFQISPCFYFWT